MKSEAELRALLDDVETLCEENYPTHALTLDDAFLHGLASGLAEALDATVERCGKPGCDVDHRATRIAGIAKIRERAIAARIRRESSNAIRN